MGLDLRGGGLHVVLVLNLTHNMRLLVNNVTRLDPPAMLDPIMSTLGNLYQEPVCLPPLDPDPDSNGKPSDHLIVVMRPINTLNNKPARTTREIKVRPLIKSGLAKFEAWIQEQKWREVLVMMNLGLLTSLNDLTGR